jgi:Cys-tRNA(Pro) deacylase
MPQPARSAAGVAAVLGLEISQVAKAVVFLADDRPVMAVLPGDEKVDFSKLKKSLEASKVKLATPEQILDLTGYLIGATPPVALVNQMPVYIDIRALKEEVLYVGGGEPNSILKIRSYDLVRVVEGDIVDIVKT